MSPEIQAKLGALGRYIFDLPEQAFRFGKTPTNDIAGIAARYGVKVDPRGASLASPRVRYDAKTVTSYPGEGDRLTTPQAKDILAQKGFDARGFVVGATDSNELSGAGGKLYPAMQDYAHQTGQLVLPDWYLTDSNQGARGFNSIGSLVRNQNAVMVPHQSQLRGLDTNPSEFFGLSPEEQAGGYALTSSERYKSGIMGALRRAAQEGGADSPAGRFLSRNAGTLGVNAASDPAEFQSLSDLIRGATASANPFINKAPVSPNILRMISNVDAVNAGAPSMVNPENTTGIFRRYGGLV